MSFPSRTRRSRRRQSRDAEQLAGRHRDRLVIPHWFLVISISVASFAHARVKKDYVKYDERSSVDLARLVDELHVLGASTLSHRVVVERFKERCHWYDKTRMRDVARDQRRGRGSREDRLTLELAKYLHDSGLFVLVRPRIGNLEPDVR